MGIEPTLAAWEAAVLPLNYARVVTSLCPPRAAFNASGRRQGPPAPLAVQKLPPTVANAVVCLPPFSPAFRLTPRFASSPNRVVRAPTVSVV